ncbi:MAG: hypothetical protein R3280_01600 [Marinobacter sp.]|uniref:FFLEELY motif protein n=1 Tax=Marinobacter sp. TaxID=50741 RepID=UPI00299D9114|nr:hypothetical protein [Marinobacter sp.]MDX1633309.1 hypothetical protein [Marinobacter sp.]
MYRQRLAGTPVTTDSARRLQNRLLSYHDFRQHKSQHPLARGLAALGDWQAARLRHTHADLYHQPGYHQGLEFLLTDLYAPAGMTRRDDNLDRIFPRIVKWLPENLQDTLAGLVELNHVTQRLDLTLLENLAALGLPAADLTIGALDDQTYCEAFRAGDPDERERQIALVAEVGQQLDRYVRNRSLGWLLSMSRAPAEMAELSDLHSFMYRGYRAFQAMERVDRLIKEVVRRESEVMARILAGHPAPFSVATEAQPHNGEGPGVRPDRSAGRAGS